MSKKQNIKSYNSDGLPHGYFERYYSDGNPHYKGNWINDKRNGYWEWYNPYGRKTFYLR